MLDRRDYDVSASQEVQATFNRVASQLESLIAQRNRDVEALQAQFDADGVSADFHAKELRWKAAAEEVQTIIRTLRSSMEKNDGTAEQTLSLAKAAVASIG